MLALGWAYFVKLDHIAEYIGSLSIFGLVLPNSKLHFVQILLYIGLILVHFSQSLYILSNFPYNFVNFFSKFSVFFSNLYLLNQTTLQIKALIA